MNNPSNKVIQSYVWHKDKAFFVSTVNKHTSSLMMYGCMCAETLVWEWDEETRERGKLIWQDEDSANCIATHVEICQKLQITGVMENRDE